MATQTKLTTRSPVLMNELRRLWHLLGANDIRIRPRYICAPANIWPYGITKELDRDDWQLNPKILATSNPHGDHTRSTVLRQ
jgi:hypothetical protein